MTAYKGYKKCRKWLWAVLIILIAFIAFQETRSFFFPPKIQFVTRYPSSEVYLDGRVFKTADSLSLPEIGKAYIQKDSPFSFAEAEKQFEAGNPIGSVSKDEIVNAFEKAQRRIQKLMSDCYLGDKEACARLEKKNTKELFN